MSVSSSKPDMPADIESRPFWEGAAQGRFLYKTCRTCGEAHFYPRSICPHCFSSETEWREAGGNAVVYSYSVQAAPTPLAIAYVTLAEGPTVLTNIVESDLDKIAVGAPVKLVFQESGSFRIPMFRLC